MKSATKHVSYYKLNWKSLSSPCCNSTIPSESCFYCRRHGQQHHANISGLQTFNKPLLVAFAWSFGQREHANLIQYPPQKILGRDTYVLFVH